MQVQIKVSSCKINLKELQSITRLNLNNLYYNLLNQKKLFRLSKSLKEIKYLNDAYVVHYAVWLFSLLLRPYFLSFLKNLLELKQSNLHCLLEIINKYGEKYLEQPRLYLFVNSHSLILPTQNRYYSMVQNPNLDKYKDSHISNVNNFLMLNG